MPPLFPILYDLIADGNGKAIRCHLCGSVSYNRFDVAEHYCGRCHKFLDDEARGRLSALEQEAATLRRLVSVEKERKRT